MDIGLATDPDVIWQQLLDITKMKPMIREETWPVIDQFFREMPEAIRKIPTFQEALAESQRQGKQQGKQIGEQNALIHLLRHKFSRVPSRLVQHIEATNNLEQLDNWLVQVISAKELAEIDFKVSPTNNK